LPQADARESHSLLEEIKVELGIELFLSKSKV
jgi:hypothetical protein